MIAGMCCVLCMLFAACCIELEALGKIPFDFWWSLATVNPLQASDPQEMPDSSLQHPALDTVCQEKLMYNNLLTMILWSMNTCDRNNSTRINSESQCKRKFISMPNSMLGDFLYIYLINIFLSISKCSKSFSKFLSISTFEHPQKIFVKINSKVLHVLRRFGIRSTGSGSALRNRMQSQRN